MNSGPPFSAQITHLNGSVSLLVTGELDLASSPRLRTTVADLAAGPSAHLTIDLTDLAFADLAGLRALDAVRHDVAEAGADFRLVGVNEYLLRIIRVAGFADLERACAVTHQRLGR